MNINRYLQVNDMVATDLVQIHSETDGSVSIHLSIGNNGSVLGLALLPWMPPTFLLVGYSTSLVPLRLTEQSWISQLISCIQFSHTGRVNIPTQHRNVRNAKWGLEKWFYISYSSTLPEDPNLMSRTHVGYSQPPTAPTPGHLTHPSDFCRMCTQVAYTYM